MADPRRLLLVGPTGGMHLSHCFERAAQDLGLEASIADTRAAAGSLKLLQSLRWRLFHTPAGLERFSASVLAQAATTGAGVLFGVGLVPLRARELEGLGRLGVRRCIYLTDDPWTRNARSRWLLEALPHYDLVCTPRRVTLSELRALGCAQVRYLPFAYDERQLYPEAPQDDAERERLRADVTFVGGGDVDRVPFVSALARAGLNVHLYGGGWDRFPETRPYHKGIAQPPLVRRSLGAATVAPCLVRRANRDGHVMRTFEVPAVRGCMLAERTYEHLDLLGPEGERVLYFETPEELVAQTRRLVADPALRERLAAACHAHITGGHNTYRDRLRAVLEHAS